MTETTEAVSPKLMTFNMPPVTDQLEGIHRAILQAVRELPAIERQGSMSLGGNDVKFTRVEDLRAALNPILARLGVVSYPRAVAKHTELQIAAEPMTQAQVDPTNNNLIVSGGREIRDGRIPNTRSWAEVEYEIRFVYVGDNSEVTASAFGHAYDTNSDKAMAKATTAAIKRILFETFKVTEPGEDAERDPEEQNRAATTDRRMPGQEGKSRSEQNLAAAQSGGTSRRSGPQRSVSTTPSPAAARARSEAEDVAEEAGADTATGELPEPQAAPEETKLDVEKTRVRVAVAKLQERDGKDAWTPAIVDALAAEVTGKATRAEWIVLVTQVTKIANALEERLQAEE